MSSYEEEHKFAKESALKLIRHIISDYEKNSSEREEVLVGLLSSIWAEVGMLERENESLVDHLNSMSRAISLYGNKSDNLPDPKHLLGWFASNGDKPAQKLVDAINNRSRRSAKRAAEARHSKEGGSRDKKKRIQDIWASGKFSSRDICAEQECAALNMSFSTARKALRNTPNPKNS